MLYCDYWSMGDGCHTRRVLSMILLEVITDSSAKNIIESIHCQNKNCLIYVKLTGFFQVLGKVV